MLWPKVTINTRNGPVQAISPTIISASRSTDIPAFYADWFMNRLNAGFLAWVNPFNKRTSYVDFSNAGAIVFWSKNPQPMIKYIDELKAKTIDFYFQYTVNDYEAERLEPRVPTLKARIKTFRKLSELVGKERVVWRFDPICISNSLSVDVILGKIQRIATQIQGFTEKLVFSFVDIAAYKKVQNSLKRNGVLIREPTEGEELILAEGIAAICARFGISAATCAERRDFHQLQIQHNKCIDDDLLERICSANNFKLKKFLGMPDQTSLLNFSNDSACTRAIRLKDKGQRQPCGCVLSKDIGMYNTCAHLCVYCYANNSENVVLRNRKAHNPYEDRIIPQN